MSSCDTKSTETVHKPPEFWVYAMGVCYASVCSSLGEAETVGRMNSERPTGIGHPWRKARQAFHRGEPNPCPCNRHPDTHKHYLFEC